jgi:hypothetical protein
MVLGNTSIDNASQNVLDPVQSQTRQTKHAEIPISDCEARIARTARSCRIAFLRDSRINCVTTLYLRTTLNRSL